ncbi:hypothetical protein D4764_06G0006880 [Takifugu flavidus]|uniref:Uncharacterized protein n=1 Tax=Takifugu flavidus TaxID=433684 RepID=A0A5C6MXQ6_9TELE|nr:hypothetical protein D4764_06G0006880 [Takifugu flavidus]
MQTAVVLFLEKVEQMNMLVETGITAGGQFVQVNPLTQPAARITLSNVPFISDEFLVRELSRHGKVVSPIRKISSGLFQLWQGGTSSQGLYRARRARGPFWWQGVGGSVRREAPLPPMER